MQQRDELDVQVKAVKAFEASIRDNTELIEMGEAENDAEVVKDVRRAGARTVPLSSLSPLLG